MTKLYVGNLANSTGEKQIEDLFSKAGSVKSVSLILDRETGRSRRFAFVEMETSSAAQKAIGMLNGTVFEESLLTVNVARESGGQGSRSRFSGRPKRSGKRPRGRRY